MSAIAPDSADGAHWLALSPWLRDNGRDDEAVVVRALWPALRDRLAAAPLEATLDDVARNARLLPALAREVEGRASEGPDDGWPAE